MELSFLIVFAVALGKHYTSLSKEENGNGSHVDNEEETIQHIMKYEKSAAALVCKMKSEAEFLDHQLTKDVVGVVATLGKVDDVNLSRLECVLLQSNYCCLRHPCLVHGAFCILASFSCCKIDTCFQTIFFI